MPYLREVTLGPMAETFLGHSVIGANLKFLRTFSIKNPLLPRNISVVNYTGSPQQICLNNLKKEGRSRQALRLF